LATDLADAAVVRTPMRPAHCSRSVADTSAAIVPILRGRSQDTGKIKPGNLREHIRLQGVTIDLPVPA